MGSFDETLGDFSSATDQDAAVKFALLVINMDRRFEELAQLVKGSPFVTDMEGEPGWLIERRTPEHEAWPEGVLFHVYVNPKGYSLAYPDAYCSRDVYLGYVRRAMNTFIKENPTRASEVSGVLALV